MADKKQALKKCFVITPIGNETDPIRRHIDGIIEAAIKPALGEKYDIRVAHKITTPGSITKQVIEEIYKDELVIANLTNNNPNVMYELAFRHSLGKPAIIIAEEGTKLPFDISGERAVFYKNDPQGALDLRNRLQESERSIDFESSEPSGLIYSMMREIDRAAQIIKDVDSAEGKEGDTLRYILQRLDDIDNKVRPIQEAGNESEGKTTSEAFLFYYKADEGFGIDKDEILNRLNSRVNLSMGISVQKVIVAQSIILVYVVYDQGLPSSYVADKLRRSLEEMNITIEKVV